MLNPSPVRAGFDAVKRAPSLAVIEIAWRWIFGLVATVLLLLGLRAFLAGLSVSPADEAALRGSDVTLAFAALMHLFQEQGVWERFFGISFAVVVPSVLVWVAAATLGRVTVLKRLLLRPRVDASAVLYLTIARAALLFVCIALWYLWMIACAFIAMSGDNPDYPLYLLLSFLALPFIAIGWGILNWILSFAPLFVARDSLPAMQAYNGALSLTRQERSRFISVTTWLGIPRVAAMILVLVFALVALLVIQSPVTATVLLTLVTLVYCALADYLYVVRLAAYSQIADKTVAMEANALLPPER
jgi:hypothetical protein